MRAMESSVDEGGTGDCVAFTPVSELAGDQDMILQLSSMGTLPDLKPVNGRARYPSTMEITNLRSSGTQEVPRRIFHTPYITDRIAPHVTAPGMPSVPGGYRQQKSMFPAPSLKARNHLFPS